MFFSPGQGCTYLIKNTNTSKIIDYKKYYDNLNELFSILIYFKIYNIPVMQSWIFSIITPAFNVTWSFRNHSNMLICC